MLSTVIFFLLLHQVFTYTNIVPYSLHKINSNRSNRLRSKEYSVFNQYHVEDAENTSCEERKQIGRWKRDAHDRKDTLKFGGTVTFTSELIPFRKEKSIADFFSKREHQKILLCGLNNSTSCGVRELRQEDINDNLVQEWKSQSKLMGAMEPNEKEKDNIVTVKPPGIRVAGLSIVPTSTIGTKCITSTEAYGLPEFQAVLIHDLPIAEGKGPLVWLFNKIVYGGDPTKEEVVIEFGSATDRKESGLLRVWVEPKGSHFYIKASSTLWLEFQFPRFLIKFFPMRKEKGEKICSEAIIHTLEMNLVPAVQNFCDTYMKWRIT